MPVFAGETAPKPSSFLFCLDVLNTSRFLLTRIDVIMTEVDNSVMAMFTRDYGLTAKELTEVIRKCGDLFVLICSRVYIFLKIFERYQGERLFLSSRCHMMWLFVAAGHENLCMLWLDCSLFAFAVGCLNNKYYYYFKVGLLSC